MLPILSTKYCCGGGNALLVTPLWPMNKRGQKFLMGLFQCKKCREYSLRGESQAKQWNCFVEILNESNAKELMTQKKEKQHVG